MVDTALLQEQIVAAVAPQGVIALLRHNGARGTRPMEAFGVTIENVFRPEYRDTRTVLEELTRLVEQDVLTLRVAGVVDVKDAHEAHRKMEAGGLRGRMVLKF